RELSASQIIDRLRSQLGKVQGVNLYLQPAQDITVGGRVSRAGFQYTLQSSDIAGLSTFSQTMLERMKALPQLTDVSSDLLANPPQIKITITRAQAARFAITPQMLADTLNGAFGQRQITQYFPQPTTYFVVLEILPDMQKALSALDRLYVKSPITGAAVPLSTLVEVDTSRVAP